MITYLYWALVIALMLLALYAGSRFGSLGKGAILACAIFLIGWLAYYFHYQQVFVKRFGGVMHINVPAGQRHLGSTWKDDNLWIENFDPETNQCIFSEYSKGNLLEGRVILRDCNPLMERAAPAP
jgi:hypothetical protein